MFQKFVLLYAISEDEKDKFDLIKAVLDRVSMHLNPNVVESDSPSNSSQPVPLREGERYNTEFERHHRSAMETGKPDMAPWMAKSLASFYERRKNPVQTPVKKPDPSELG